MRGEGIITLCMMVTIRITPAHAGRSLLACDILILAWDHPRACGEKAVICGGDTDNVGSPPRMRGED